MIPWSECSVEDKEALIIELQETRANLLNKLSKKRKTKKITRKAKSKKKMTFKNKELEELFHNLPKDVQRFISGG